MADLEAATGGWECAAGKRSWKRAVGECAWGDGDGGVDAAGKYTWGPGHGGEGDGGLLWAGGGDWAVYRGGGGGYGEEWCSAGESGSTGGYPACGGDWRGVGTADAGEPRT